MRLQNAAIAQMLIQRNTVITAHLSEQRIENMLADYWERYGAELHSENLTPRLGYLRFFYAPSMPEVDAEN